MSVEDFNIDLPDDGIFPIKLTPYPVIKIPLDDQPNVREYIDIYIQRQEYWTPDSLGNVHDGFSDAVLVQESVVEPIEGGLYRWSKKYTNIASILNSSNKRITYEPISVTYPAFYTVDLSVPISPSLLALGLGIFSLDFSSITKVQAVRVEETYFNTTNPSGISLQSRFKAVPDAIWSIPARADPNPIFNHNLTKEQLADGTWLSSGGTTYPAALYEDAVHKYSNPTKDEFLGGTYFRALDDSLERYEGNIWVKKEYFARCENPLNSNVT